MDEVREEIKSLGIEQLRIKVVELRKELLMLRLNSSSTHVKDYSQFKKLRRRIALALTCINQKSANVVAETTSKGA